MVEVLIKLEGSKSCPSSISNEYIRKWALDCKRIYEDEYRSLEEGNIERKSKTGGTLTKEDELSKHSAECDSDETTEMTEEEIDLAFNRVASIVPGRSR